MRLSALSLSCMAAIAAGIAASLAATVRFDTSPVRPARQPIEGTGEISLDSAASSQSFQTLLERPVFSTTRRPFVQVKDPAADTPTEADMVPEITEVIEDAPPKVRLFGIAQIEGRSIALISVGNEAQARWLGTGDKVGEWALITVDRDKVVIAPAPGIAQQITVLMSETSAAQDEGQNLE